MVGGVSLAWRAVIDHEARMDADAFDDAVDMKAGCGRVRSVEERELQRGGPSVEHEEWTVGRA